MVQLLSMQLNVFLTNSTVTKPLRIAVNCLKYYKVEPIGHAIPSL